ncbi:MAG: GIY-YIG nuclease family protein [Sphingomonadales bacterium]|nr:GIY-YIG nuclease family protein [Sphingomonadales bacterium]
MTGGYFYILANRKNGALYAGVTKDIRHRIVQHRKRAGSLHAKKYDIYRLVYVEEAPTLIEAIAREKAVKKWRRLWKVRLIEAANPDWRDLYFDLNR